MKLLDIDAEILALIFVRADATVLEISKLLGIRPHVCRNALDRMLQRGVITRRVVVNPARLGYRIFGLWFSLSPRVLPDASKFIKALTTSTNVSYVGEFSGEFEWRMDILARRLSEADRILGQFSRLQEEVFVRRRLSCLLSIWDFPLKTLSRKQSASSRICVDLEQASVQQEGGHLQDKDLSIVRELTADGSQSQSAIARKLSMASTTVGFRISQLREKKVIVGYHLVPEVESLRNYELSFRLHRIRLRQLGEAARAQLLEFATKDPAAHGLTQCIGDIDAEICSASTSIAEERAFDLRLKGSLGKLISSVSVLRMLKHHKVNACPW